MSETSVTVDDLILPFFVTYGEGVRREVESMPGVQQWSVDRLPEALEGALDLGIRATLLFGIPEHKDAMGSRADDPEAPVQRALRLLKREAPDMVAVADLCLCEYTDHGHCGIPGEPRPDGTREIRNDETLPRLASAAVSLADAGADVVAPSGMMDGMVGAIRSALDGAGHEQVAILSYSTKYASAFYGPFRDAAHGAPRFGDRSTYQMDPANVRESSRENRLDLAEGADMLMVKPALAYLDVIRRTREHFPDVPLAAYNVSGEYAMLKAAAARGWIDERRGVLEILTGMKRAGADLLITYHAEEVARWLT